MRLFLAATFACLAFVPLARAQDAPVKLGGVCEPAAVAALATRLGFAGTPEAALDGDEACTIHFKVARDSRLQMVFLHMASAEDAQEWLHATIGEHAKAIAGLGDGASFNIFDPAGQSVELNVARDAVDIQIQYIGMPIPAGADAAKAALIDLGRALLAPASDASARYLAAIHTPPRCGTPGEEEYCPIPVEPDMSAKMRQFTGTLSAAHGGHYLVITGGATLAARVTGPKGVMADMQCDNDVKADTRSSPNATVSGARFCRVDVAIAVEQFEAWGPYTLTLSWE